MRHHPRHRVRLSAVMRNVLPVCAKGIACPPMAAGINPTTLPMPNPLSRAQLERVKLTTPPAAEYAAKAPIKNQSAPGGKKENRPVGTLKPKKPRPASSHREPLAKHRHSNVSPPKIMTTRTQ